MSYALIATKQTTSPQKRGLVLLCIFLIIQQLNSTFKVKYIASNF